MLEVVIVTRVEGVMSAVVDQGDPIPVKEIKGTPRPGGMIDKDDEGRYVAVNPTLDPNCLNGVCSIALPDNRG